ncbi:MAG: hypothetical protein HPY67_07855 [Syntrophaceae bacterium]|nr:hypothetical protein [Syntrophaceae bacterium]
MREEDLIRDLQVRNCPVCHHLERGMEDYFAELQGLLSRSEAARGDFADDGGLCPLHTWQLAQFSSPRGIARGHEALSRKLAERLEHLGDDCAAGQPVTLPRQSADGCRACRFLAEREASYVEAFCRFVGRNENLEHYRRANGLCLGHLRAVLAGTDDGARRAWLIRAAAERLREIGESMRQYDLKLGQLQRERLTPDEKDAYRRGLVMLSGERSVVSPFLKGR